MFRGVTEISIDAKGRMAMPKRFRDRLMDLCAGQLVITVDIQQKCLAIYPLNEWDEIEQKIDALSSFNSTAVHVKRKLMGSACDVDMDANGRILIPPKLRKYANLDKRSVLIGQRKKFELWDEEAWDALCDSWEEDIFSADEEMPAELESLSL